MEIFTDKKVKIIIEKIRKAVEYTKYKNQVYVTGGCIRDSLLGRPINDIDIAVEAPNGAMIVAFLVAAREGCFKHGSNPVTYGRCETVMLRLTNDKDLENIHIEFTQTMKKPCSNGNVVGCYGSVEEDSKLRDLSINAIYYNISKEQLLDFNGGLGDFHAMILRTPHKPNQLFAQDPIKMLRIIKTSTELGWGIEKNTWFAILRNYQHIQNVAQEKITEEFAKILLSDKPSQGLSKLYYCGLMKKMLPDIYDLNSVYESPNSTMTSFEHTLKVVDAVQPFIKNRLAALFHDVGNVVNNKYRRAITQDAFSADVTMSELFDMKFSNDIILSVGKAIRYHRAFDSCEENKTPSDKKIRKFVNNCADDLSIAVDLMSANNLHGVENKPKLVLNVIKRIEELNAVEEVKSIKLPIDGNTLMKELNIKGGPIVGNLLDAVKDAYLENPKITKKECIKIAKQTLIKFAK